MGGLLHGPRPHSSALAIHSRDPWNSPWSRGAERELPIIKGMTMPAIAKETKATIIPCLRYRDAPAAIEWLCKVFGFEKQMVVPGDDGTIAHAQLSFGNGMIMIGSVQDSEFGRLMKQPDEIGGAETQAPTCRFRRGRHLRPGQGGRRRDPDRHQGRGLRGTRFYLPRSRGPSLELRHLRPVGGVGPAATFASRQKFRQWLDRVTAACRSCWSDAIRSPRRRRA